MNNKNFNATVGYTHAGVFHADDVMSTALLKLINPSIEIRRVFKVDDIDNDTSIVYDIGMGQYDHHQMDNEVRENGIPYASFGKLWRDFGHILVSSERAWEAIERSLVQPIDDTDNGGNANPLSIVIHNLNPAWDSDEKPDDKFWIAVEKVAIPTLQLMIQMEQSSDRAVEEVYKGQIVHNHILVLNKFCPWQATVIREMPEIWFVIFPSNRGGYNIQTVPVAIDLRENRVSFKKEWLGNPDSSLGMTFCHPGNFIAACTTCDEAINVAKICCDEQ